MAAHQATSDTPESSLPPTTIWRKEQESDSTAAPIKAGNVAEGNPTPTAPIWAKFSSTPAILVFIYDIPAHTSLDN